MSLLLFLALGCLAGAVLLIGEVVTEPSRQRFQSARRAATYGRVRLLSGRQRTPFKERVLQPAAQSLARLVLRVSPKTSTEAIGLKLMAAGMGRTMTTTSFLAAKGCFAAVGVVLGLLFGKAMAGAGGALLFGLALCAGGFMIPDFVIGSRARRRRENVRAELPDALDLLAVSVEAGLGFDGAIAKLTEHLPGALTEEFGLALGEMRIGESRAEALKKMSQRVDAPELAAFVRAIIQADQLGISLGRILRIQAADTRLRRQAAAEERAMKAPVKMLFPTVIFIFPSMFLVILGPALLNLTALFGGQ
ncbi:MAG: type II secretion system F family protein [Actinomycetota bacterium]|nr:type II secretion system F family protein [Actinomycetota bacterium]